MTADMSQGEAVLLRETVARHAEFDAFYGAEHVRLFRSLLLLTSSREEAEDVAHEAFVRVLERWERVKGMASPRAYLYRTALNLHRNGLRRRWRRARLLLSEPAVERDTSAYGTGANLTTPGLTLRVFESLPDPAGQRQ